MKHILLANVFNYKRREQIVPPLNYTYNKRIGAWISNSQKLLVYDTRFPSIASKKRDIETGEDEKGQ